MELGVLFDETVQMIWDKFHVIPDDKTLHLRYGFNIQWKYGILYVTKYSVSFKDQYNVVHYDVDNTDEALYYITLIINRIRPYRVY